MNNLGNLPTETLRARNPISANSAAQITFVLHDAGETKALQPVMRVFDQKQISYHILADSTAVTLLQNNPHIVPLPMGASTPADIISLANSPNITSVSRARAMTCLQQLASTRCVVTGLVSDFQKKWTRFFNQKSQPVSVVGYYDGFTCNATPSLSEDFINPNQPDAATLGALMTPSKDTADFFRRRFQILNPQRPAIPIGAVGQPVLETTANAVRETAAPALAARLGIDRRQPTLLFVGGYGPNYPEAFRLFCQTAAQFPNANLLVALHPKMDGTLESQVLAENPMIASRIKMMPREIDTTQLLALAPIVLSQDSTFIFQAVLQGQAAAYIGKPVSENPTDFNPLLAKGMVARIKEPAILADFIQQCSTLCPIAQERRNNITSEKLGIPQQATDRIVNYLQTFLRPTPVAVGTAPMVAYNQQPPTKIA